MPVHSLPAAQPSDDFLKKCHYRRNHYTCKHQTWERNPRVTHIGGCNYSPKTRSQCPNMASKPMQIFMRECCSKCQPAEIDVVGTVALIGSLSNISKTERESGTHLEQTWATAASRVEPVNPEIKDSKSISHVEAARQKQASDPHPEYGQKILEEHCSSAAFEPMQLTEKQDTRLSAPDLTLPETSNIFGYTSASGDLDANIPPPFGSWDYIEEDPDWEFISSEGRDEK